MTLWTTQERTDDKSRSIFSSFPLLAKTYDILINFLQFFHRLYHPLIWGQYSNTKGTCSQQSFWYRNSRPKFLPSSNRIGQPLLERWDFLIWRPYPNGLKMGERESNFLNLHCDSYTAVTQTPKSFLLSSRVYRMLQSGHHASR